MALSGPVSRLPFYATLESPQGLGSEKLTSLWTNHQTPTPMSLSTAKNGYLAASARNPEITIIPLLLPPSLSN